MSPVPLSKIKIESKVAIIRAALVELAKFSTLTQKEFTKESQNFAVAEHHLRRALEATFDLAGHIASRLPLSPGQRPHTLKGLALILGTKKIVSADFAKNTLVKMAGYRNRMVHFYDEITPKELYEIVTQRTGDVEKFVKAIVKLIKNPKKFGLTIE